VPRHSVSDTLAFAELSGVGGTIETYPLEQAALSLGMASS